MEKQNGNRVSQSEGVPVKYDLTCNYEFKKCFYVFTCQPVGGGGYECLEEAHFIDYTGICCVPIC